MGQAGQHVAQIFREDRLLLHRGSGVLAADAGQHSDDMAILAVQRLAALRVASAKTREAPFDG